MKYQVKRMTPEFRAIAISVTLLQAVLIYSLYQHHVSVDQYLAVYAVLFVVSMIVSHYRTDFVDETQVTLND